MNCDGRQINDDVTIVINYTRELPGDTEHLKVTLCNKNLLNSDD